MATTPQAKSKSPTIRRILREAAELSSTPAVDYAAEPLESDLFEWHFTLRGPPNSSYSEGLYHGRIVLPPTYPLRPPSFRFTTPNGRFEANREICLSISGHHEETWQPAWGIRTAIVALRSFMETDAKGQLGGVEAADHVRRRLAGESGAFRCSTCGRSNAEIIKESEARCAEQGSNLAEAAVEVPSELRMGFRDEMEAKKGDAAETQEAMPTDTVSAVAEEAGTAQMAQSLAQSAPEAAPLPVAAAVPQPPPAAPAQGPAQPTNRGNGETTPQAAPQAQPVAVPLVLGQPRRLNDDGIPLWIDRAIVVLVVLLAALLLKIMFDV